MRSRSPLSWLLCGCLLLASSPSIQAAPQVEGRRVSVSQGDAQDFLDSRFPVAQDALGGLLEVTASHPRLAIPAGSRMRLAFDRAVATAGGTPVPMGNAVVTSALHYDPAQKAFFLAQPRIDAFHAAGGGEGLSDGSRDLLNAWLADYARSQPVYRIEPAIAALLGDLQVESAGIQDGRLVVTFNREVGGLAP
jgi:hypothetical protein